MKVLYFGTFDSAYGRNRVIIKGLKDNGVDVIVCNGGITGGVKKYARLLWLYWRLSSKDFNLIIVAFPAQEVMLVAGLLFLFKKSLVVADMLTSHYDGYILDRKKYSRTGWHATWYHWLDGTAIRLADLAIVDSDANGRFFVEEFQAPPRKLLTVLIGADDSVMKPVPTISENTKFLVHFHGKFIPHQGIGTIVKAAALLEKEKVTFQIIGRGQDYDVYRKMATTNIAWIDSVLYEQLPEYINKADICLGPMGGTDHFHRCAPNKIYEYMACGKAIVTGRSKALEGIAVDGANMLLVNPADEHDLAQKILLLKNDKLLRDKLGKNAYADFLNFFTPQKLMAHFIAKIQRKTERILMTGGTGFIGSRLYRTLTTAGYAITNYVGDINDISSLENHIKNADIVIHLAAKNDEPRQGRESDEYITVNVLGTQRVADLCLKYKCKLLFFSSVVARHPTNLYGLSKTFGEQLVRLYGLQYGLKAMILRPYGIHDEAGKRRLGKPVNLSRGRNYPLARLAQDVERIMRKGDFSRNVKTYTTTLFWQHTVLYWPRKIFDKVKKIV